MEEVEQFDNITIEELAEGMYRTTESVLRVNLTSSNCVHVELPENAPRYIVLSYELKHEDGRTSFPLVLINWAPRSAEMGLLTLHASAFLDFQATVRNNRSSPGFYSSLTFIHCVGRCEQSNRGAGWRGGIHEGIHRQPTEALMIHGGDTSEVFYVYRTVLYAITRNKETCNNVFVSDINQDMPS